MKPKLALSAIALALAVVSGPAAAESLPKFTGGLLVDAQGMTLYTFDKDVRGKSNCNGGCAAAWPPAPAAEDAGATGDFTIITRDDGARQWAYKGSPLYRFAADARAGEVNGDDKNGAWHAVRSGGAPQGKAGGSSMGYTHY
jgi:predicted lipoprotein with Yx(FWY)xxD motif